MTKHDQNHTCDASFKQRQVVGVFVRGFFMGLADIVPGVSGGTIAYITGIYPKLVEALALFTPAWFSLFFKGSKSAVFALKQLPFLFLLPLVAGIASAFVVFIWVVPLGQLVSAYPKAFFGFFFGVVFASALQLFGLQKKVGNANILFLFLGGAVALLLPSANGFEVTHTASALFLAGALAICAMLLPGISGALVLVLLGQYAYVLEGVRAFSLPVLVPFTCGLFFGILAFAQILQWLLKHYNKQTMLVLTGLLFGTLRALWPAGITPQGLVTFLSFSVLGVVVVLGFTIFEYKFKPQLTNT